MGHCHVCFAIALLTLLIVKSSLDIIQHASMIYLPARVRMGVLCRDTLTTSMR